jgi:hypothetical protein
MANKRMFAKTVISADTFVCMPLSAQALYFHFGVNADDDGFIDNPKSIQRMIGATDGDLKELLNNGYIIQVGVNLYLVKHWRLNNNKIEPKKYTGTIYKKEFDRVILKNNVYELKNSTEITDSALSVNELCTNSSPTVHEKLTGCDPRLEQNRLDKSRVEQSSIYVSPPTEENTKEKEKKEKSIKHSFGTYKNVSLSDEELEKLKNEFPDSYQSWIERVSEYVASTGKTYKNYLATIRNWAKKETTQQPQHTQYNTSDIYLRVGKRMLEEQERNGDVIDD